MAEISLNLDTTKTNIPNPTVVLRQGDSEYQSIRVTVSDNYTPVDITTAVITFMGTTPAGTKIVDTNVSKASDTGVFDYTFPSQAGSTAGVFANAYFKITDGDKLGSTASFTIQVLDSIDMTQAEASDYVSVVDEVIKTTVEQVNSDIQTATSHLSDKVTQANSAIDAKVAGVGAQIDNQVATATDKLNQTIATGNYASQDYVQQTVTSGINAINKVANASHADVADSLALINGVTNITNMETWGSVLNHGATVTNGDITVNGAIHGRADTAGTADSAKQIVNGSLKGYISLDGVIIGGSIKSKTATTTLQFGGMNVKLSRNLNTVTISCAVQNWAGGNVDSFSPIPASQIPAGYRPVNAQLMPFYCVGNTTLFALINQDGTLATTSWKLWNGVTAMFGYTYQTADDMPG